jgi:hypothetical protein
VNNAEARRFYEGLGAVAQEDFVLYRVTGEALAKLGAGVNR